MTQPTSRRRFLQASSAAVVGGWLAGPFETARGFGANDTINVACLGTGGRCRRLMTRLADLPNVRITAVCDVWDHHLAEGKKLAHPDARQEKDYRRLLERDDVDAVVIGTPDHWHVPMTVDACTAGKDVFVEKPLTHSVEEGERVIEAQNRHKRIVQVGTQQRSMPHLIEAREIIRSGVLGKIHKVHMSWNRNHGRWVRGDLQIPQSSVDWKAFLGAAPDQPFDAYRFRNWRWFWDFGGGIFTDLMVHWMDTAYWMLDLSQPSVAMSIGDHFGAKDLWETPDTVQTLLRFPEQEVQVHFEGTFVNHNHRAQITFMGTEANLYCDRGRWELHPQRGKPVEARERIVGVSGVRGADFFEEVDGERMHLEEWLASVRTRETPSCPAEEGVRSAAAAHLANASLRSGEAATTPTETLGAAFTAYEWLG